MKHLKTIAKIFGLLLWTGGVMLLTEIILAYLFYFLLGRETLQTPVWTTVVNALIYATAFFLTVFLPVKFKKMRPPTRKDLGLEGLLTWTDLGLVVAGFIAYLILAMILMNLFSNFSFFDASQTQELGYNLITGFDRLVAYFALCIIAPIAEELTFRGWLYDKLRKLIPGKKLSIVLSSLLVSILFGLMHGQWNVGVNVFAMSLVLCTLREITGTTYSGILLHMLKNTIAFVLVYLVGFI
ncbi:CPBP family intramembrane metalloprotease [Candidatus Saccharibacteria bacterium]|nr:CPBP family intramembrane metalloprotease [Candidatus Saccharibacteria bacterium]